MPKVVKLQKKKDLNKSDIKSPHVLDLRKEIEKKEEVEKQKKIKQAPKTVKFNNYVVNKKKKTAKNILFISKKIEKKIRKTSSIITSVKYKTARLASATKFKPDVSSLFSHRPKKTKISNKTSVVIQNAKKESEKVYNHKLVTPFFVFRIKNSAINISLFLLFVSMLILPIKGFNYVQVLQGKKVGILEHATAGASYLQEFKEGGLDLSLNQIQDGFSNAQEEFILAQEELSEIGGLTQTIIKITPKIGGTFKAGEKILALGENLTQIGRHFTGIIDTLQNDVSANNYPTVKLEMMKNDLVLIIMELRRAEEMASEIDINDIPLEYQDQIAKIKKYLLQINNRSEQFLDYLKLVQKIFGHNGLKRYLVVFQNNNEIRPTGGFAGSYALIDFNQGKITNIEIPTGGAYDLEGGEKGRIASPKALQLISPYWHFWDANWFFDFPTSAEKMIEFYNFSGGPTVDGVISINATMLQDLIGAIGPIRVEGFEQVIDGSNLIDILQEEHQNKKFEQEPKKLLSLAGPEVLKRLTSDPKVWFDILPIIAKGFLQKDLQMYFSAYDIQRNVIDLGWGGRMLNTKKDYLAVVHTNLGGGKTDQHIQNEIWHNAEILESGDVVDTLIITRHHQGDLNDKFTGVTNNDFIKVYVPKGSTLIGAKGFTKMPAEAFELPEGNYIRDEIITEIENNMRVDKISGTITTNEFEKTVFSNWLQLKPGEIKSVYIKYKLPFTINKREEILNQDISLTEQLDLALNFNIQQDSVSEQLNYYSLIVQKQSGLNDVKFVNKVSFPQSYGVVWSYPKQQYHGNEIQNSIILNKDIISAVVFK